MALGKKKCGALKSRSKGNGVNGEELGLGLEFVKYTRGLGRKRILISSEIEESMFGSPVEEISPTRLSGETVVSGGGTSRLEALPQDILIRIICGVEHEDLKLLFTVSKTIRAATLIAKQSHFAFSTPKKTLVFRSGFGSEEPIDLDDEIEAPNAPKRKRFCRSRICDKEVSGISMSLFT